jgi:hypothetical protein
MNDTAFLHALVVAAADDFSVANQDRADGDSAARQPFPGFLNRCCKKWIHAQIQAAFAAADKF